MLLVGYETTDGTIEGASNLRETIGFFNNIFLSPEKQPEYFANVATWRLESGDVRLRLGVFVSEQVADSMDLQTAIRSLRDVAAYLNRRPAEPTTEEPVQTNEERS